MGRLDRSRTKEREGGQKKSKEAETHVNDNELSVTWHNFRPEADSKHVAILCTCDDDIDSTHGDIPGSARPHYYTSATVLGSYWEFE